MLRTTPFVAVLLLAALREVGAPATAVALNPYDSRVDLTARNGVDELVFGKLEQCKIQPATVCSDGVFVRRAYLDIIGTLPNGYEAKEFVLDRSANKRRALIDRLLERDERRRNFKARGGGGRRQALFGLAHGAFQIAGHPIGAVEERSKVVPREPAGAVDFGTDLA